MEVTLAQNEMARLKALRRYHILDTICEAAFDDLTRLAAQICGTPIALITLVDEYRQWFKSKLGIDAESTSRDVAFCAHAILQPNEILIVPDTLLDHRFATNPTVTSEPHIRFYAGAPLVTPEGYALGTICVVDYVPRKLSIEQLEALRTLSRQVIAQLELKRNLDKLEKITTVERLQMDDLVSTFSHGMRTPLLATRSALHALLGGAFGKINDSCIEVLKECSLANENILSLVEGLLDVSRHQNKFAKSLNYEILNWENIFIQAIKRNNSTWKQKCTITYKISPSLPIVFGDELEIQRVVDNLLDNAVRVSALDREVILEVEHSELHTVKISVRDRGFGISPEQREKLFHRFVQGRRGSNGTGFGLYLCRQIVEAHGGNIGVETNVGEGSTFWFTLPLS